MGDTVLLAASNGMATRHFADQARSKTLKTPKPLSSQAQQGALHEEREQGPR